MRALRRYIGVGVVIALSIGGLSPLPTRAAHGFEVNSTLDEGDSAPGDGTCATAGAVCTLRAAVQEANSHPGVDTITVPTGSYVLAIAGQNEDGAATGDLDLTESATIVGDGQDATLIKGGAAAFGGIDRVFHVLAGATVSFADLAIMNGNEASTARGGGGIANLGTTTITDVTFSGNTGCFGGALLSGRAEAPVGTGTTTVVGSTFTGNRANCAGSTGNAIHHARGVMTIDDSTVDSNGAPIPVEAAVSNLSSMTITDTTISNNAGSFGGGLNNGCCGACCNDAGGAILSATNVTLVGNSATAGGGGFSQLGSASSSFTNSTITGNTNGGIGGTGMVTLKNTIVADQTTGSNCGLVVVSQGGNLDSGTSCGLDSDASNPDAGDNDWVNTDPQLGPLANNGGPTETQRPATDSPVVDGGVDAGCASVDQRGVARPHDGDDDGTATCDVGAFELARYALSVATDGDGSGTVSSADPGIDCGSDCSENSIEGTLVTLAATPDTDNTFDGWSGEGCSGTADCVVTMSEARSVTATFSTIKNTLNVAKDGAGTGSVTSSPAGIDCGTTCAAQFDQPTVVTLTATPDSGSKLSGWAGEGCSGAATCQVTMDQARSVTATFLVTRVLTVTAPGRKGLITSSPAGITCAADCSEAYVDGTSVTLTAKGATIKKNSGKKIRYRFVGWTGACAGTEPCVLTMDGDKTVGATFAKVKKKPR